MGMEMWGCRCLYSDDGGGDDKFDKCSTKHISTQYSYMMYTLWKPKSLRTGKPPHPTRCTPNDVATDDGRLSIVSQNVRAVQF
jgi:hypothetical protein